ncbi:DUF692 domain-containing protein [Afipia massiliensis]|uniref:UPF0276 protein YH63_004950 n=1 Tax=Afipia massiliensis TaxID=211460 RepID=A0A4U6BLU5_9BRAD|nr:DUF692 domain-containing protein [Afipia massiliensis]TKT70811.1 DUF692 domain-containing protein [Afipia massiliensis]
MSVLTRLPISSGIAFKPQHFPAIMASDQPVGFFEIHAENYMGDGGAPHAQLHALRERYALSLHGVGLSIGSMGSLDRDHLARLKHLCEHYQPHSFSEHLAWSSHGDVYLNDLLPLPYTEETLERVVEHVDLVQSTLGRRMLLENPSAYLVFAESVIPETEFLDTVARRTDCGLLLDVNNVFVSARNHSTDPLAYLAQFPLHRVGEIHLGGHDEQADEHGDPLLIDAHGTPIAEPVWRLYEYVIEKIGPLPTLIEWDNEVPEWHVLAAEAQRVNAILTRQRLAVAI